MSLTESSALWDRIDDHFYKRAVPPRTVDEATAPKGVFAVIDGVEETFGATSATQWHLRIGGDRIPGEYWTLKDAMDRGNILIDRAELRAQETILKDARLDPDLWAASDNGLRFEHKRDRGVSISYSVPGGQWVLTNGLIDGGAYQTPQQAANEYQPLTVLYDFDLILDARRVGDLPLGLLDGLDARLLELLSGDHVLLSAACDELGRMSRHFLNLLPTKDGQQADVSPSAVSEIRKAAYWSGKINFARDVVELAAKRAFMAEVHLRQAEAIDTLARFDKASIDKIAQANGRFDPECFVEILANLEKHGIVDSVVDGETRLYFLTPLAQKIGRKSSASGDADDDSTYDDRRTEIERRMNAVDNGIDNLGGLVWQFSGSDAYVDPDCKLNIRIDDTLRYVVSAIADGFRVLCHVHQDDSHNSFDITSKPVATLDEALATIKSHVVNDLWRNGILAFERHGANDAETLFKLASPQKNVCEQLPTPSAPPSDPGDVDLDILALYNRLNPSDDRHVAYAIKSYDKIVDAVASFGPADARRLADVFPFTRPQLIECQLLLLERMGLVSTQGGDPKVYALTEKAKGLRSPEPGENLEQLNPTNEIFDSPHFRETLEDHSEVVAALHSSGRLSIQEISSRIGTPDHRIVADSLNHLSGAGAVARSEVGNTGCYSLTAKARALLDGAPPTKTVSAELPASISDPEAEQEETVEDRIYKIARFLNALRNTDRPDHAPFHSGAWFRFIDREGRLLLCKGNSNVVYDISATAIGFSLRKHAVPYGAFRANFNGETIVENADSVEDLFAAFLADAKPQAMVHD